MKQNFNSYDDGTYIAKETTYGNTSCILYFKQNINTHVKNYVLADAQSKSLLPPASITSTTTTSTSLIQQPCPGKSLFVTHKYPLPIPKNTKYQFALYTH